MHHALTSTLQVQSHPFFVMSASHCCVIGSSAEIWLRLLGILTCCIPPYGKKSMNKPPSPLCNPQIPGMDSLLPTFKTPPQAHRSMACLLHGDHKHPSPFFPPLRLPYKRLRPLIRS